MPTSLGQAIFLSESIIFFFFQFRVNPEGIQRLIDRTDDTLRFAIEEEEKV